MTMARTRQKSQEHSRLLLLVERRCYLSRDWLTRAHTAIHAKYCTLGTACCPPPFSQPRPLLPTHAHRYTRARACAHFARARNISIVGDLCTVDGAARISLTRVRTSRFTLASTILRHSRTGTAGGARENPLLMLRVGRNSGSGGDGGIEPCAAPHRAACAVRFAFGLAIPTTANSNSQSPWLRYSAIQAGRFIWLCKTCIARHRQD